MEVHKPQVKKAPSFAPVWFIPIVALVIGAWLVLRTWQEKGPEVEIILEAANGIQVGQTEIRLKDVPVGKVTKVLLSTDLDKVRVFAVLDRQVSPFLSENTRFWLVSPRISAQGISNLGTLISGVYIVMDPGKPGAYHEVFKGLSEPPPVESDELGTSYILHAESLGSIDIGSPVYFRQIRVGEVTGYKLAEQGSAVEVRIFVEAPHDRLVLSRSRFWNVSGVSVEMGADGLEAHMESLVSLISGGIAFENAVGFESPERAKADHAFYLYSDRNSVLDGRFNMKYYYLLKFSHSVRGLSVGAPVEFRGIKVGAVESIELTSVEKAPNSLHVYVSVEPQRLDIEFNLSRKEFDDHIESLVEEGLQATLKTASLITGSRYVDLSFDNKSDKRQIVRHEKFTEIPALDYSLDQLDQKIANVADKVGRIPFEDIGNNLNDSLASLKSILHTLDSQNTVKTLDDTLKNVGDASSHFEETVIEAKKALAQLSDTLAALDAGLAPDSSVQYQLQETLKSIRSAADSFGQLTEKLNRKPDSLIFGNDEK